MKKFYYMIGVNGRQMPNLEDRFTHLDCIEAEDEKEARDIFIKHHEPFLRDLDKELVEVYDYLVEYEPPYDYLIKRNHIK